MNRSQIVQASLGDAWIRRSPGVRNTPLFVAQDAGMVESLVHAGADVRATNSGFPTLGAQTICVPSGLVAGSETGSR